MWNSNVINVHGYEKFEAMKYEEKIDSEKSKCTYTTTKVHYIV